MANGHNKRGFSEDVRRMMRTSRLTKLKLDTDLKGEVRKLLYG
jgi:hypothetical protein